MLKERKLTDTRPNHEPCMDEAAKLKACIDIGKLLTSTLDLSEILELIMLKVSRLIHAQNWSLLLRDKDTGELTFEVVEGENSALLSGTTIERGVGIAGHVAETGEFLFLPDVRNDPRFHPQIDVMTGFLTKSIICVPLKIGGKTLGVIEVINVDDMNIFEKEDLPILKILADYAAIAIQNSHHVARIRKMSITDEYTGLYNARYLHQVVDELIESAPDEESQFSIVFADIDEFKSVVDGYGHLQGSQVLREIGRTMASILSDDDILVKYGGDEYVIVLPGKNKDVSQSLVADIMIAISESVYLRSEETPVRVTASFGISTYPEDAQTKKDLFLLADNAMYSVKRTTKNAVAVA